MALYQKKNSWKLSYWSYLFFRKHSLKQHVSPSMGILKKLRYYLVKRYILIYVVLRFFAFAKTQIFYKSILIRYLNNSFQYHFLCMPLESPYWLKAGSWLNYCWFHLFASLQRALEDILALVNHVWKSGLTFRNLQQFYNPL